MRNIEDDLYCLRERANYSFFDSRNFVKPIYKNTNERLTEILTNFDFTGKEVLSVMASADQPFSAYYLGAKNVDTFDINWASYYFYYLKKWYLMYYKKAEFKENSKRDLIRVLDLYDKSKEEECLVYELWYKLIKESLWGISNLFLKEFSEFVWTVPYNNNLDRLIDIIKDKEPNFQEFDITTPYDGNKKYDIIILSNIMESFYPDLLKDLTISENLKIMLNSGGIVINSILNDVSKLYRNEREEFICDFEYEISEVVGYNANSCYNEPLYYTYRKK